ncbi:MAG: FAD/NAD(P)-binding protein [Streptosporangiaceae bacterium]|nr:FAD/NAD(P)-binding protein [Streptosporangiaceae bacterium]MBV9855774.1 FAD/NAD(P)-binding protein [Streptosporangiaceae bacterium]
MWADTEPWRLAAARRESADTVTLGLEPPAPFVFDPGQFNMLYAAGIGEVPISISGDPGQRTRILHTIRDVGAVTHALCATPPGTEIGVRGPYGSHWPLHTAEGGDLIIVAGGIGLPPLRPAIYQALRHRDRYQRLVLLYGARTPRDLLFTGELARWRGRFDLTVEVTVDVGDRDWRGNVGVVPDLIGRVTFEPGTATAFMVGPEIMMRFTVRALLERGVPEDRVFLSMERNMQCAAALCGHCQLGPFLLCRDGPVLSYRQLARWISLREI